jgi:hypothetical protein
MTTLTETSFLREIDKKLWTAAYRLRSSLDAAVYKHVVLGLIPFIILPGCRDRQSNLSNIPELPDSIAVLLDTVVHRGLIITASGPQPTCPPAVSDTHRDINCESTTIYYAQLNYPITICAYPEPKNWEILEEGQPGKPAQQMKVNRYKLTTLHMRRLNDILYCRTRGGPWTARIIQKSDCNNVLTCDMMITGVPEDVPQQLRFFWCGSAYDHPAELRVFNVGLSNLPVIRKSCGSLSNCGGGVDPPDHP